MEWLILKILLIASLVGNPPMIDGALQEAKGIEISELETSIEVVSVLPEVPEILLRIAECESGNRQFNEDGSVVRGKQNPQDIGRWQINLRWNGERAEELGYDLFTEEGNLKMALYLYETRGTKDWSWSRACWSGQA